MRTAVAQAPEASPLLDVGGVRAAVWSMGERTDGSNVLQMLPPTIGVELVI